jgi:hypothetical protein
MAKTYTILEKAWVGAYHRTTVSEGVRKILGAAKGDDVVWIYEDGRVLVDRASKRVKE